MPYFYNTQNILWALPIKRRQSKYLQSLSNLKTPTLVVLMFFPIPTQNSTDKTNNTESFSGQKSHKGSVMSALRIKSNGLVFNQHNATKNLKALALTLRLDQGDNSLYAIISLYRKITVLQTVNSYYTTKYFKVIFISL